MAQLGKNTTTPHVITNTMACDQFHHIAPLVPCLLCGDIVHVQCSFEISLGLMFDLWVEIKPSR